MLEAIRYFCVLSFIWLCLLTTNSLAVPPGEDRPGTDGPTIPDSISYPSTNTSGSFTISWTDAEGYSALKYRVSEQKNGGSWTLIGITSYPTMNLPVSGRGTGDYKYMVVAWDDNEAPPVSTPRVGTSPLKVRGKPGKPTTPVSFNSTSRTITVSWSKPSGTVTYYDLQRAPAGTSTWSNVVIGHSTTSTSNSVPSDGSYDYRVRACNGYGWACSDFSNRWTATVATSPSKPATPANLNSISGNYSISWSKPGGAVHSYKIKERQKGGSWGSSVTVTSTSYSPPAKPNNTDWEYIVEACNTSWSCSGYSGANLVQVRFKPSAPAAPSAGGQSTNGALNIYWAKPSGTVTHYKLKGSKSGNWTSPEYFDSSVSATSQSVNGLSEGNWKFQVQACNQLNWACSNYSGGSGNNYVRFKPQTPLKPTVDGIEIEWDEELQQPIATNSQNSDGTATVRWTAPEGTVTYYDIQKSKDSWLTGETNISGLSKQLSGLTDGDWQFRVRACNGFSWACSSYSIPNLGYVEVRIPPGAPALSGPATNTSGTVTLYWERPTGNTTFYRIEQSSDDGANFSPLETRFYDDGEAVNYSHSVNEGDYIYRIQACNSGYYACSEPSNNLAVKVRFKPSIPSAPADLNSNSESFTINWTDVTGANLYLIEKRVGSGSFESAGIASVSQSPQSGSDQQASHFHIAACNDFTWACSKFGPENTVQIRVKPPVPTAPNVPSQTVNQSALVTFDSSPSAGKYYKLLSRKGTNGGFSEHDPGAQITAAATTVDGLTDGTWYFRLMHCNGFDWACSGETPISAGINARQLPQNVTLALPLEGKPRRSYDVDFSSSSTVTQWTLKERRAGSDSWNTAYQGTVSSRTLTKTQPETWEYQLSACNTAIACVTTGVESIDITPLMIGDIYDAGLETPLIPDHDPSVGHLNPEVGVNGGTVNLSLSIAVPPGRAGVQPKVSLKYNSTGGNGLLGLGGTLVAGGAIRRCADIYQLDNRSGSVTDDAEDKLCLNGERLVLANSDDTYGDSGSVYYPETNPQLKVIQSSALASASFTVRHSDGTVDYYGDTSNSQLLRNGSRVAWKLRKSQDFHNNSVLYNYTAFEGGSRLSDIYYTGNGDTRGNRRVQFIYEARPDKQVSYRNGSRRLVDRRLEQVRTYANGKRVRDYDIAYYPGLALSKIETITLCGWNTAGSVRQCYPATEFDWNGWQSGFAASPVKTINIDSGDFGSSISASSDMDGDGISDILVGKAFASGFVNLSGTGQKIELPFVTKSDPGEWDHKQYVINNGVDINLDGRADHIGMEVGGEIGTLTKNLKYARWNGSSFVQGDTSVSYTCSNTPYFPLPDNWEYEVYRACTNYALDLDGDGVGDLAVTYQTDEDSVTLDFYRGQTDGSYTYLGRSPEFGAGGPFLVTDLDGDGAQDLVGLDMGRIAVGGSVIAITTSWTNGSYTGSRIIQTDISSGKTNPPLYYDANQDGFLDVLIYDGNAADWRLYINAGGNLSLENSHLIGWGADLTNGYASNHYSYHNLRSYVQSLDYNRDGITDLLVPSSINPVYEHQCIQGGNSCLSGTGDIGHQYRDKVDLYNWSVVLGSRDASNKIVYASIISLPVYAPLTDVNLIDYDGNGYTDFVTRFGRQIMRKAGEPAKMTGPYLNAGVYVFYSQSTQADMITGVTTALGVRHEFEYQTLHGDPNFYTVTSTRQTFPRINGSTHSHAIKEYRTSDGLGGLSKTTFSYKDALFHLQGRGHQGFREIIERKYASASDSQPYAEVITEFAQTFPQSGSVVHQETRMRNVSGNLVKTASVDNQLSVIGGQLAPTQFAYANSFTTKKFELDGSLISTEAVTRTYNYLGLLTGATSVISDAAGEVTRTTTKTNNFTLDTDNWWFRLEDSAERHRISYGDPLQLPADTLTDVTVTKTYEYTDSGTRQPSRVTTSSSDTSLNLVTTNRYTGPYKQLDRVTLTSNGSGNTAVEGSRWTEMDYSTGSDNGYFVTKTYNSAWGLSVAANSASYDPRTGLPFTQTDANGNTTSNQYDHFGHLIESDAPGVPTQKLFRQWCSAGCPSAATSRKAVYFEIAAQAGAPQVFTYYDARGREVYRETEGTDGTIVQWQSYDNRGRITQVVDPHYTSAAVNDYGMVDFTAFDGLSRPIGKTVTRLPISYSVDYAYSGLTTEITVTPHGLGEVLMMVSRSTVLGQPMYHQDARDQFTRFRYDALGNVAMIQDVSGNAITARYNGLGHKIALNDPNMGQWQFAYNALGELRWQRDAKGQVSIFNYDSLGRLVHQYPGSDAAQHFEFDINHYGTLDREYTGPSANPNVERIYTYDTLQRETARITQIDGHVFTRKTVWDGNYGRIKGLQYPDGTFVETLYDQMGRIAEEWDYIEGVKLRTVESRSATEAITRQSLANALIEESQYNAAGLLDQRCVSNLLGDCSTSNLIYDQYDSYGNLKHRSNSIAGVEESFTYDNLHRLTQSTRSWEIHIPATLHSTVDYDYDAAGNLLYKSDFSDRGNAYQYGDSARSTNNAGPNAVTRVTLKDLRTRTFQYDLNGNLTADGIRSISYGVTNKPKSITHSNGNSAQFHYGPDGSRYKQVVTDGSATTTRYYLGAYEYEETEKGGSTTVVERTTVGDYAQYRIETINGAVQSNGWEFLHRDHLGSIESITDISGEVRERRGFDPFGKVRDLNEDDGNGGLLQRATTKRGFTGHEHLDGVELIHANGRAYDYNLGRFLSVDPFISMPENSQAYNPYSYVMNNPLRYTDPTGYVVQQNCSPACDVDDIETRSQKRAQKERIEKRINNLLKEAILLGNGSATKVGEDDSSSSANVENSGAGNSITGFLKGIGQAFLDDQAQALADGIGIQDTDSVQSSIQLPISDSELGGVGLAQSAVDNVGMLSAAVMMVANLRNGDATPSREMIMGSFSLLVKDGAIDASLLSTFLPSNLRNSFRPTDRVPAGQKYMFKIGDTKINIKWHSRDLGLKETIPQSNSARVWTAQIQVGRKFLMTNGQWTRKQKSNRTHIPIIR